MADDKQVYSLAEQRLKHDLEHCQAQLKEALDGWNESAELLDRAIRERDQARAEGRAERDRLAQRGVELLEKVQLFAATGQRVTQERDQARAERDEFEARIGEML